MDTKENQVDQSGCGCDSTSGDDTCCTPGGKKNWRTALFIGVVVLAGAVAAHSVLTNGDKGASTCGSAGGLCAIEQGNGNGGSQTCAMEQGNGNGDAQACSKTAGCPMEKGNGNGDAVTCSKIAGCCPMEQCNGNCEAEACPKAGAGCCPGDAPAAPTPQAPPSGGCPSEAGDGCGMKAPSGCCPGDAPATPTPQAPPSGCPSEAGAGCGGGS